MAEQYGFEEILRGMLDKVPDTVDKREGSIIYDALAPTAYMLSVQNYMVASLSDMLFGDTAEGEWLDRVVKDFGLTREAASYAVRRIVCLDSDGNYTDVAVGSRFSINGLYFSVSERLADGSFKAVCEQEGSDGNRYSGIMVPVDNIPGLASAELDAAVLIAARDTESDDELRERFYLSVRESPFGGNRADYHSKALSIEGVGACAVFAASDGMGAGNVGLVIGDEQGRPAGELLINKVKELFGTDGEGLAPVGHTVSVKTAEEVEINSEVTITLKSGSSGKIVEHYVAEAAKKYINGLDFSAVTVFYSKLAAEILNSHEAILDAKLTINGDTANITLEKSFERYQIPVFGEMKVNEAVM